jgi:hypothetical protein
MAPKVKATALSDADIERLHQYARDAQQSILSAQEQIVQAQASLGEINNILSTHAVNAVASAEGAGPERGAAKAPKTTNQAKSIGTKKIVRAPTFSTSTMTDEQAAFLRLLLGNTKKTKSASPILKPVDHVAIGLTTYFDEIEEQMDLGTMTAKLHGNEYDSVQSWVDDLQSIVDNAKAFNGPAHGITHAAYAMLAWVHEKLEKLLASEGMALKHQGRKRKCSV